MAASSEIVSAWAGRNRSGLKRLLQGLVPRQALLFRSGRSVSQLPIISVISAAARPTTASSFVRWAADGCQTARRWVEIIAINRPCNFIGVDWTERTPARRNTSPLCLPIKIGLCSTSPTMIREALWYAMPQAEPSSPSTTAKKSRKASSKPMLPTMRRPPSRSVTCKVPFRHLLPSPPDG